MSTYRHVSRFLINTYEGVALLRTDHGLIRLLRSSNENDPEYHTFDPYVTLAIIRLGDGESLERS